MKVKLSFKEYLDTKTRLKEADKVTPKVKHLYEVRKYCKIPLYDGNDTKTYISLKPKDTIEILWEYLTEDTRIPLQLCLTFSNDEIMTFVWNDSKVSKWVDSTVQKL